MAFCVGQGATPSQRPRCGNATFSDCVDKNPRYEAVCLEPQAPFIVAMLHRVHLIQTPTT